MAFLQIKGYEQEAVCSTLRPTHLDEPLEKDATEKMSPRRREAMPESAACIAPLPENPFAQGSSPGCAVNVEVISRGGGSGLKDVPSLEYDPSSGKAVFHLINAMHWDSLAFLYKTEEDHTFNLGNFLGFIPAVPFNINSVSEIIIGAIKESHPFTRCRRLREIFHSIIKGDLIDTLKRQHEESFRQVLGDIKETESRVDLEMTLKEPGQYDLEIYNPGYADRELTDNLLSSGDPRYWIPLLMKYTDFALTIFEVVCDVKASSAYNKGLKSRYIPSSDLLKDLRNFISEEIIGDSMQFFRDIHSGSFLEAAKRLSEMLEKLALKKEFWEFLSRHYFQNKFPDLISREAATRMMKLLSKIFDKAIWYLAVADVALSVLEFSIEFSFYKNEGRTCGPVGYYRFTIESPDDAKSKLPEIPDETTDNKDPSKKPPNKPLFYELVSVKKPENYILLFNDGGAPVNLRSDFPECPGILEWHGSFWAIRDGKVFEGTYIFQINEESYIRLIDSAGREIAEGYNDCVFWDEELFAIDEI